LLLRHKTLLLDAASSALKCSKSEIPVLGGGRNIVDAYLFEAVGITSHLCDEAGSLPKE